MSSESDYQNNKFSWFLTLILPFLMQIIVVVVIYVDTVVLKHGITESSLTEILQSIFALSAAVLFFLCAKQDTQAKGFLILVSGFFLTIVIREADLWFDKINHGFWVYPALVVILGSCFYSFIHRSGIMTHAFKYINAKSFSYIVMGLIIVLIFSRVFGSGVIWKVVMAGQYSSTVKAIIQEGIELLGYSFIFLGALGLYLNPPQTS